MAARLDDAWALSVLLVEDDPEAARRMTDALAQYEGVAFRIEQAVGVEEGLRILQDQTFDVMVLDLSLPEGHGLTAFLRAKEAAPSVPIVVVTDEDDESLAVDSVGLGAQEYRSSPRRASCRARWSTPSTATACCASCARRASASTTWRPTTA